MNHEPVRMVEQEELTELLDGPFRRWVLGNVEMQDPPRADLHGDEDVNNPKRRRDGNEEVAGYDALRMVPYKRAPSLAELPRGLSDFKYLLTVRGETVEITLAYAFRDFLSSAVGVIKTGIRHWRLTTT
jgi:hypothetical protein